MAQDFGVFVVLLLCVSYHGVYVNAACPTSQVEAETAAKNCLKSIGLDMDAAGAGGAMGNDITRMEQYCKDGTMQEALGCVQTILDDCAKENANFGAGLKKAISISNLRSGIDFMCQNMNVLKENGECVQLQQGAVATCVQVETEKFQKELEARQNSGQMKQDDIWVLSCGFIDNLFACQHEVYESNCGKEIADVMTTFMQAAKPPVCADYSGSSMVNASWSLLACLLSLYIYLVRD